LVFDTTKLVGETQKVESIKSGSIMVGSELGYVTKFLVALDGRELDKRL
jgi:hypothetical protein